MKKKAKTKGQWFVIHDFIFDTNILVGAGVDHAALIKRFKKFFPPAAEHYFETPGGLGHFNALSTSTACMIWFRDAKPKAHTVSHECLHATAHILRVCGVKFSEESEETYAYHQGMLVRYIGQKVW